MPDDKKASEQQTTKNKNNTNPPTPSQAEGSEETVDKALRNDNDKSRKQ